MEKQSSSAECFLTEIFCLNSTCNFAVNFDVSFSTSRSSKQPCEVTMVTDITTVASRWNVPGECGGDHGCVATPIQAQAECPSRSEGEVFSSHAHTPRLPKPYTSAPCVCSCLAGVTPAGGRAVRRGSALSPCCAASEFLPVLPPPGSPAQTLPSSLPASVNPLPSLLPASPALAPSLGTKKPLHQHTSGIFRPSPAPRGPDLTSHGRKLTYWSGGATCHHLAHLERGPHLLPPGDRLGVRTMQHTRAHPEVRGFTRMG